MLEFTKRKPATTQYYQVEQNKKVAVSNSRPMTLPGGVIVKNR